MKPSSQQQSVIDWAKTGTGSANVIARAGTGKTTLLMHIAKAIPPTATGFMGAFNKSIADEFKSRLIDQGTRNVNGATIHSAGMSAIRRVNRNVQVDGKKTYTIVKDKYGWDRKLVTAICDTVSFAKQAVLGVGLDYKDSAHWEEIIDNYETNDEISGVCTVESLIDFCKDVYKKSLSMCDTVIDFDDMLLAPLYYKFDFPKYDWVMIDEAQDTNRARRMIALGMMHKDTRMISVGDDRQAIYRFAGANSDAMDLIATALGGVTVFPLTVTYRCPKAIVDLAQVWVPDFTAHENAPEGAYSLIDHRMLWEESFSPKDVILCRNTRPLMGIASRLRDMGIPCVVEGVSAKGLLSLAVKWGEEISIDSFLEYLDEHQSKEVAKYQAKDQPGKVEWIIDRCDTLRDICRGLGNRGTTRNLTSRINLMFGVDQPNKVLTLSTIHRAKGKEWNRVYLIGRNRYMPSPYAESPEDILQEENLMYVAVTRSKDQLIEVNVPKKEKGEVNWWEV